MDGPTDLDVLADALREDGVVVDRVIGSGDAQGAHDRIAALVREVPFPVYVALVEHPEGLPTDSSVDSTEVLAGLLHRRLGDGLYVVESVEGIQQVVAFGLDASPARLSLGAGSNRDALDEAMQEAGGYAIRTEDYLYPPAVAEAEVQVLAAEELVEMAREPASGDYPVTVEPGALDELAERAVATARTAEWRPGGRDHVEVRNAESGTSVLTGGLVGLVVALLLGQTLRGWPRNRRRSAEPRAAEPRGTAPPDLETERARARELLDTLVAELADTDWTTVRDRDVAGRALTARDALSQLVDSGDVADLVGAQVIARIGVHDLARGRLGAGDPVSTCFFDPRHPDASGTVSWPLGDGDVEVPCCATCRKRTGKGRAPEHLRLPVRRGAAAYWERDDVWARTGFGAITDFLARDVLAARAGER